MKKKIAILGATGSIGKSSLDVISRNIGDFEAVLLSAHSNKSELEKLAIEWPSAVCVLSGENTGSKISGKEKLLAAIHEAQADITINAIAGGAGLEPSLAAIKTGSTLALANKETVVMAGEFIFNLAKKNNVKIIPVDSEHSAIFKLLEAHKKQDRQPLQDAAIDIVSEIILTASGGPFRNLSLKEMEKVTVKDALSHPTWKMGKKITIDSASMANKGLEIIEASHFFETPSEKIKVVIHPQSIVHSMIKLQNGVVYAQLSNPDMRYPIHDALYWPLTTAFNLEPLDYCNMTLTFEPPDTQKFPMLKMAYKAAQYGNLYPCAYNAANEEAVFAFLENKIGFTDIPKITGAVLEKDWSGSCRNIDAILKADKDARLNVMEKINLMKGEL